MIYEVDKEGNSVWRDAELNFAKALDCHIPDRHGKVTPEQEF